VSKTDNICSALVIVMQRPDSISCSSQLSAGCAPATWPACLLACFLAFAVSISKTQCRRIDLKRGKRSRC
jgi:hypothetical protein